jgi:catechol 2,3-dioxygenase-like lactoylglutathione lyase family enzyme
VRVRDLEKSQAWYEGKLGLKPGFVGKQEKLVVYKIGQGDSTLTIYELKAGEIPVLKSLSQNHPIFYSRDIKMDHETLRARGVKLETIHDDEAGAWFQFFDPDGNLLEACHY